MFVTSLSPIILISIFFFFNDTATTEIYTLSLHDALPILRQQQKKWNKKVEEQNDHSHDAPFAIQPRAIEADLLRLVAGPDDQELRKIEIGPKHDESE